MERWIDSRTEDDEEGTWIVFDGERFGPYQSDTDKRFLDKAWSLAFEFSREDEE